MLCADANKGIYADMKSVTTTVKKTRYNLVLMVLVRLFMLHWKFMNHTNHQLGNNGGYAASVWLL